MKNRTLKSESRRRSKAMATERGLALIAVVCFTVIITILGFSLLSLAEGEITMTQKDINKTKAFYLAEAGLSTLATRLHNNETENIEDTPLGEGSYQVDIYFDDDVPSYAISTGKVAGQEKKIKVIVSFLAAPYEHSIYAGNLDGQKWFFELRGKGNPQRVGFSREVGGRDMINGNIHIHGDVTLCEESSVNPAPPPNTYGLKGDVDATGKIDILDSASISGEAREDVDKIDPPDLVEMNYEINNTHNVSQIFADGSINSGYLPGGHELRDVVVKNPSDRADECASTAGDDYFFEPARVTGGGDQKDATTPLHLGSNRVYYVDGDVWVHNKTTYGFLVDGKATIVATGNIHICDNTKYADDQSLLGMVALGKYDDYNQLTSGGNVYFGDPRYGTTYTVSALMFAGNDFLYNTDSVTGGVEEPQTGFSVYGNLNSLNQVSIHRDWYDDDKTNNAKPAYFDSSTSQWISIEDGRALTSAEISTLRHYQMTINYDDRIRTQDTQPPGLPRGVGTIFAALTDWEELP